MDPVQEVEKLGLIMTATKRTRLSDRFIKSVQAEEKQIDFYDSEVSGGSLILRVYPSGRKTFFLRYRTPEGTRRRYRIGDTGGAGSLGLSDARKEARKILAEVGKGRDPQSERQTRRDSLTVAELTELYLSRYARRNKKASSVKKDELSIKKDLIPRWGKKKAQDINRLNIIRVLESIAEGRKAPIQANRVRALIHKIFSFAVEQGLLTGNPASGLPRIQREEAKDRVLSHVEINQLLAVLATLKDRHIAGVFQLILLTGQRPGEVCKMEWKEVDSNVWTIPKEKAKNGRAHRVALSSHAMKVLVDTEKYSALVRSISESHFEHFDRFVFPSPTRNGPITWINKACDRLIKESSIEQFTPHDLRRTCATGLENMGVSSDTISAILNHIKTGMVGVYQRGDRSTDARKALERWGDRLMRSKSGMDERKVVNLR